MIGLERTNNPRSGVSKHGRPVRLIGLHLQQLAGAIPQVGLRPSDNQRTPFHRLVRNPYNKTFVYRRMRLRITSYLNGSMMPEPTRIAFNANVVDASEAGDFIQILFSASDDDDNPLVFIGRPKAANEQCWD